jgi:hypothetical protein
MEVEDYSRKQRCGCKRFRQWNLVDHADIRQEGSKKYLRVRSKQME